MRAGAALVVFALALGAAAGAESFLSGLGRSLFDMLLAGFHKQPVNYSKPVLNVTYTSSLEFDMRAMGPVYNVTPLVIDTIAPKQAYPEGMVIVSDGHVELSGPWSTVWRPLLAQWATPGALCVVALAAAAALPLAGLCWAACRCCRARRRRRPAPGKCDRWCTGLLAILLIALLTLFLFGVVVAFATDAAVEEGAAGAGGAVRAGLRDARGFLDATQAHARHLLVYNYRELQEKLVGMIGSSGMTISLQLREFSRAMSVTTLTQMVRQLDGVQADLRDVVTYTQRLRANAEQLNTVLRSVKAQLLQTLARCDQPQCIRLQEKHKIGQLDTEIHYSQMPDVSELLSNVTALLNANIKAEVEDGERVLRDIQVEIERSVSDHLPSVKDQITAAGHRLEGFADQITYQAGNVSVRLRKLEVVADSLHTYYEQYGPYRLYVGRGTAAALLTITVVLTWGLLCGVCGKRPDPYGTSDCCDKGSGSTALLCGMALMFLLGAVVALVLLVHFAAGLGAQRLVCDPLTEPRGSRVFADVDAFVQLERALFNERTDAGYNLSVALARCHANLTVYQVFELHRLYDLAALGNATAGAIARRVAALRPAFAPAARVTILRDSAKHKLRMLADSGLSDFDFDRILNALETNMTSLALDQLSAQLEGAARGLAARPGFADVAATLHGAARKLAQYHADIVAPMRRDTDALNATAARLRDTLRFNHSSLKEAIAYLMDETDAAEAFLNKQGAGLVQDLMREFAKAMSVMVNEYLEMVQAAAEHELGRCGPVSRAFNVTRDAHCRKILMPVHGYWLSLAWCLALFPALLLVARRLASLWRRVDTTLADAEYLYDAYADRDNVPLANTYKAESGKGRPPARRYNDMAPKHWEEGPPRYHGPTEYERPPPYYYPGPNDRQ